MLCAMLAGSPAAQAQAWTKLPAPAVSPTPDLFAVHFITPDRGYVGGEIAGTGVLYLTTDAGVTWEKVALPGTPGPLNDVYFPSSSVGIVVGDGNYAAISIDGGASWMERSVPSTVWPSGGDIQGVYFKDATIGFVVGKSQAGSGPRMARTVNGGATWENVPMTGAQNNLYDIDFFDANHGTVVGTGNPPRKSISTDGGSTWEPNGTMGIGIPPSLSFYGVDAIAGTQVAFAAGGMVVTTPNYPEVRKSTDGGATWQPTAGQPGGSRPLRGLIAITKDIIYVSGQGGTAHRSVNGGTTWTQEALPPGITRDLRRFHSTADNQLYLVGYSGVLLRLQLVGNAVFTRTSLNFDKLCPDSSRTLMLPVGNDGGAPLAIDSIVITQPAKAGVTFTVVSWPATLAPGETTDIPVRINVTGAADPGLYTGAIRIYNNDENRTGSDREKLIPLTATITTKTLLVDKSISTDAGTTRLGSPIPFSLPNLLTADGECQIRITSARLAQGTDFRLSPPLPTLLTSGQRATIALVFMPQEPCARFDTLIIEHDGTAPASPVRIPIAGNATVQSFSATPRDTLHFGSVLTGTATSMDLLLQNAAYPESCLEGTDILSFRITGPNAAEFSTTFSIAPGQKAPIAPGDQIVVPITVRPATAGIRIAYAVVATDIGGRPPDTIVLVTNALRPELTTTSAEIRFPATDVGGRRDSTIADFILNLGNTTATLTDVRITGTHADDFLYGGPSPAVQISSGGTQAITVGFRPSAPGIRTATLELATTAATAPIAVTLVGNAARAAGETRSALVLFQSVPVSTCQDSTLNGFIHNTAQVPLRIHNARITAHPSGTAADPAAFTLLLPVLPPELTIQPGDSSAVQLRFCPAEERTYYARLILGTNTPGDQFSVDLIGAVRAGDILSVDSVLFPRTRVLVDRDTTIDRCIINRKATPLRVDSMNITGADAQSFTILGQGLPLTISPGTDAPVTIRFNPRRRGWHRGTLEVHTSNGAQSVALEGLAVYPFLEVVQEDQMAHRVRVHTTQRLVFNIRNRADESADTARIDNAILSGSTAFTNVTAGPFPVMLKPGESVPIVVDFIPGHLCEHDAGLYMRGEGVRGSYGMADTTVIVTGIGIGPMVASRAQTINFGLRQPGTPTDSTLDDFLGNIDFSERNAHCLDATTIDSLVIAGPEASSFSLLAPSDPLMARTLAAGSFQPCTIRFLPATPGPKMAHLLVYFDGRGDSMRTITLLGGNSVPEVKYGPSPNMIAIDFGNVPLGASRDSFFTITNTSTQPLEVHELRSTRPTEMEIRSPRGPLTLAPGVPETVRVRFSPVSAAGQHRANVIVQSGSIADSSFSLYGNGTVSAFRPAADTVDFKVRNPGMPIDTTIMLLNETTTEVPDPSFLDSVLVDTAAIVAGSTYYDVRSYPDIISPNRRAPLTLRFSPAGVRASRKGIARIYYNRRVVAGETLRDSIDIILTGIVDGPTSDLHAALGGDRTATPGDTLHIPLVLSGGVAGANFDSLVLGLRFRRTMLRPLAISGVLPGMTGDLSLPDDAPGHAGTALLRLAVPAGFAHGTVCDLVCQVLLPDTLESVLAIGFIGVPERPDVLFTTDSIRLATTEFCDAQGRIIRFDTLLTFSSKPNPAARATQFDFTLPAVADVRLSLYDATGSEIGRLADGPHQPGRYSIPFDASSLASGSYYCILTAGRFSKTLILRIIE